MIGESEPPSPSVIHNVAALGGQQVEICFVIKIIIASGPEKPYYIKKLGMSEKGRFLLSRFWL